MIIKKKKNKQTFPPHFFGITPLGNDGGKYLIEYKNNSEDGAMMYILSSLKVRILVYRPSLYIFHVALCSNVYCIFMSWYFIRFPYNLAVTETRKTSGLPILLTRRK